jgi:hypothetical protein
MQQRERRDKFGSQLCAKSEGRLSWERGWRKFVGCQSGTQLPKLELNVRGDFEVMQLSD